MRSLPFRLTSLALPDDSVSFKPELLLLSSRASRDFKPLLEPDEFADNHGFVRMRERSRGDCTDGETNGGGIDDGTAYDRFRLIAIIISQIMSLHDNNQYDAEGNGGSGQIAIKIS
ncbi:hypothetical protein X777_01376 [Ooceraea biroi]|uniref:Uncharacterized protein n=1 Tax=Ooceraea biroi TaxID=2015173 RepID=A0A026WTJ2_OOCBI|nr:hypothetical protein X777_01376 [Ooceraea biroi]